MRGISLRRTRFGVFIVSGRVCGFAAVLFTASTLNFVSSEATYYLLPVRGGHDPGRRSPPGR